MGRKKRYYSKVAALTCKPFWKVVLAQIRPQAAMNILIDFHLNLLSIVLPPPDQDHDVQRDPRPVQRWHQRERDRGGVCPGRERTAGQEQR